ncbi:hypothetical protein G6L37_05570 [Agrobacterium rubi]|nr:hypothetical protein [Agrobacterium rubi]NTF24827.1 hypothetical protein [Agrobacterium rubi]
MPFAISGQLQAASGSNLEGKSPEVVARFTAGEFHLEAIMDELHSGRIVLVTGIRTVKVNSVDEWLASRAGPGAQLLAELRRAHDDPNRGSQIYPMMFSDDTAIEFDRSFFVANPQRYIRMRPLVGDERMIGELNYGWTDRVISILVDRTNGIQARFFFGCPENSADLRFDQNDASLAQLALRYARSDLLGSFPA